MLAGAEVAGAAAVDDAATVGADDEVPALEGAALFELDELHAVSRTGATHSVSAAIPNCLRRRTGDVYMRAPCS